MTRNPTYASGLNEVEHLIDEMEPGGNKDEAPSGVGSFSMIFNATLVVLIGATVSLIGWRPSYCDNTCATVSDGACDDGGPASAGAACIFGSDCTDCGARDFGVPHWLLFATCLASTMLLVLGWQTIGEIFDQLVLHRRPPRGYTTDNLTRVPCTDMSFGITLVNKVANSTQVREKGLKILQYVLRGASYSALFSKELSKQLKSLSKMTSVARRFFKFMRWVKHYEDLAEAHEQKDLVMRTLLYIRIAANFGADWAEDVCSLERVGILSAGTLSMSFMLFAEYCQLVLALVEIFVTTVRARKEAELTRLALVNSEVTEKKRLAQERKLALTRLELVKFVSDVGKAIYDCEFPISHEGVFIGCSLFSASISTHKNMVKVLK
jgi:hypothetical protein